MFRKSVQAEVPPEWMIVGLGNPGAQYNGTRHNVGFDVIDRLAKRHKIKLDKSKHRSRYGIGMLQGHSVILVKPLTFMNLSGQAVAPLAKQYGLKPEQILVVADDLDLEVGRIRLKPKGSAGGHNGHKSLIHSLGTSEYPRLKIGIGAGGDQTIDHVLGSFNREEIDVIRMALEKAADGVEYVVLDGVEFGMNRVNV